MKYKPSVLLVDPKKDKELENKLKKLGISKSAFHRMNTEEFLNLQGQSLSSWVREKTKEHLASKDK